MVVEAGGREGKGKKKRVKSKSQKMGAGKFSQWLVAYGGAATMRGALAGGRSERRTRAMGGAAESRIGRHWRVYEVRAGAMVEVS